MVKIRKRSKEESGKPNKAVKTRKHKEKKTTEKLPAKQRMCPTLAMS